MTQNPESQNNQLDTDRIAALIMEAPIGHILAKKVQKYSPSVPVMK